MGLDERVLDERLEALERVRAWSPRLVSKLESLIRSPDDCDLFRINVYDFAAARNVADREAVELFLHATKLGLFVMEWQLICPQCTDAVESVRSLSAIGIQYHCELCTSDVETSLDDLIQVTFTISPVVRRLALHDPETLSIEDYCWRYHFTTGARTSDGRLFRDCLQPYIALLGFIEPGTTQRFETELHPGKLKGADRVHRAELEFDVRPSAASTTAAQTVTMRLENGRLTPGTGELAAGPTVFEIHNAMPRRAAMQAINVGATRAPPRPTLPKLLSAKQLFVTQAFSDLFHSETINRRQGLALKDLTFVFTDLQGSTELYERIGDLQAFHLVEQHFDRLGAVVRTHDGAIVKTIGDAVMAAFASASQAVAASLEMLAAIEAFNRERGRGDIVLKLGAHRGACIAVTLNERLDYFGQTINIAARVQGIAKAGEICFTDEVLESEGVRALLAERQLEAPDVEDAQLKGISRAVRVHRIAPRRSSTKA